MAAIVGTRKMRLFVDSFEFTDQVSNVRIVSGNKESDFMSFAEALAGGARDYKLALTMRQDTDSNSLWDYVWNNAGTDVVAVLWPSGQTAIGGEDEWHPKYTGTVTITEPDGDLLGGEANKSTTAVFTTEVEWVYTAKPVCDMSLS